MRTIAGTMIAMTTTGMTTMTVDVFGRGNASASGLKNGENKLASGETATATVRRTEESVNGNAESEPPNVFVVYWGLIRTGL